MAAVCGDDVACELPPAASRCTAWAAGPGLGRALPTENLLRSLLTGDALTPSPVLDADALRLLAVNPQWAPSLASETILTPHPGEFDALLTPFGRHYDASDRPAQARWLAREMGVHVVLKGHRTVIAAPDGRLALNTTGNAGMATAGSGDVLTGILLALRAQGLAAWDAARLAVFVHGLAGDLAATALSRTAMTALDIIRFLPSAWKELEAMKNE